jgi:hypothetical protein
MFFAVELAEWRKVGGFDDAVGAVFAMRAGELDDALQLADVAGPVVGLKLREGAPIEGGSGMAAFSGAAAEHGGGDERDVFETRAERRDEDLDGGDEPVELAIEMACSGERAEIAAGREDHARAFGADASGGESLESLAELDLVGGRELVDAADEESATRSGEAGEKIGAVLEDRLGAGWKQGEGLQDGRGPVGRRDDAERARRRSKAAEGGADLGGDAGEELKQRGRRVSGEGSVGV